MRTIKTGVCVFLSILISIIFNRETYIVIALTSIFTLREDMINTIKYGKHRVVGNLVGALTSIIVIFIFSLIGNSDIIQLFVIPLIVVIMIATLANLGFHEGTVGACATLLTILFMIPGDKSYSYAFARVIDSFIGMGIALLVNSYLPTKIKKEG